MLLTRQGLVIHAHGMTPRLHVSSELLCLVHHCGVAHIRRWAESPLADVEPLLGLQVAGGGESLGCCACVYVASAERHA